MDFLDRFFDGSLMPHGHCLLWREDLLTLHVLGDTLTAIAYLIIPVGLVYLVHKREDLTYGGGFLLFAAFILFCGITHMIGILNIWHGYYFVEGASKLATGLISIATAVVVWKKMPEALKVPSRAELQEKNSALEEAKAQLREANERLEQRVEERTRELQKMAVTDALTNVSNRGHIMEKLHVEVERANRYQEAMCLLMIDLDEFKMINDNYGHLMGDAVLIDAAATLQRICRSSDSVGRYGGEEFTVILPNTSINDAYVLAERMRVELASRRIPALAGESINYQCSIGVSRLEPAMDTTQLLQAADMALYKAKLNGRNITVTAQQPQDL